jgi:hypothetical protein
MIFVLAWLGKEEKTPTTRIPNKVIFFINTQTSLLIKNHNNKYYLMIIGIYLYLFRQVLQSIIIITFDCKKRLEVVSYYIRIKFQERPN